MDIEDYRIVLREVAASHTGMVGLPASNAQMGTVAVLFAQFWTPDLERRFAANANWFRHEAMNLLWGHSSMKEVDMSIVSTMIDELGVRDNEWHLTDRGRELLSTIVAELEKQTPTQQQLFSLAEEESVTERKSDESVSSVSFTTQSPGNVRLPPQSPEPGTRPVRGGRYEVCGPQ